MTGSGLVLWKHGEDRERRRKWGTPRRRETREVPCPPPPGDSHPRDAEHGAQRQMCKPTPRNDGPSSPGTPGTRPDSDLDSVQTCLVNNKEFPFSRHTV